MKFSNMITVVGAHAEGEVGRVVTGGTLPPPGNTLYDQAMYLWRNFDGFRKFLLYEPRGGAFVHANLIVPPKSPKADAGFIIMEAEDYPSMSGSNCICVTTVLLETGMVKMKEPVTELVLETPGGLVDVVAECEASKCKKVKLTNVPSYAALLDAKIKVPDIGTLTVDVGFGGAFFLHVDAAQFGFEIDKPEARKLVEMGEKIKRSAREQLEVKHPDFPDPEFNQIAFTQFTLPPESIGGVKSARNTVVVSPGKLDRSPCGTGTSARMAVMHAKGEIETGEDFVSRSVIGSRFDCKVESETTLSNGTTAIRPSIAGRGWITGFHNYVLDPEDPWSEGYTVSDTWFTALD
ncbi:MAG: proline racemase family protein [Hyphomicrobiales bacterium]